MFSTLLGPLPAPAGPERGGSSIDEAIVDNVADLEATGLGLLSSGLPAAAVSLDADDVVRQWQIATSATTLPVKPVLGGPYSAGRAGSGSMLPLSCQAKKGRTTGLLRWRKM